MCIFIQNFPQMILQAFLLWKVDEFDEIAISSMIFSIISIIASITSTITEKKILNSSGYAIVEFDVTGSSIIEMTQICRNQTKILTQQMSTISQFIGFG